ncbi:Zinc finger CCCH domain-containing protein 46 [Apostasia shenzhenica]|uniref:Zinc finger CCCH domain-containing protein 46 n=1 Tax=Apostasia shenzhenica TaxID=1088818 RepID=A0A2I0AXN1_9ASPA|nr:Zinc finger CCCH domain-containing protein 46 [Apostasia shenzhenica]
MGLLLIQDHGEKEMIRLAFRPEALLQSIVVKARKELDLLPISTPATLSGMAPSNGHRHRISDSFAELCLGSDSSGVGLGWRPCFYYARGFCKNGNSCRFFHVEASTATSVRPELAGMSNSGSRQVYLTFPADSAFREEVYNYFSIFGAVQGVRIPYQQKRMFGFVTFVYPHFVCDARVCDEPYKEKEKDPESIGTLSLTISTISLIRSSPLISFSPVFPGSSWQSKLPARNSVRTPLELSLLVELLKSSTSEFRWKIVLRWGLQWPQEERQAELLQEGDQATGEAFPTDEPHDREPLLRLPCRRRLLSACSSAISSSPFNGVQQEGSVFDRNSAAAAEVGRV